MLGTVGKGQFKGCRGVVTTPLPRKSRLNGHSKVQVKIKRFYPLCKWARLFARLRGVLHPYNPQPVNRRIWDAQQANIDHTNHPPRSIQARSNRNSDESDPTEGNQVTNLTKQGTKISPISLSTFFAILALLSPETLGHTAQLCR